MSKKITCPKCSNPIIWDETQEITQCSFCGTRFRFHKKASDPQSPVFMPPSGRGTVDYLTAQDQSFMRNTPVLKTYIPRSWNYFCGTTNDRHDLISNPLVLKLILSAPDESASIYYFDETFYKHIDYTPQTAQFQGCLDDRTINRNPSFLRLRTYMNASQYCDAVAESCDLRDLTVIGEKEADENELRSQQKTIQAFQSKGMLNVSSEWAGKTYSGLSYEGQKMKVYVQSRITQMMQISTVQDIQMMPMPSVFGSRMMPQRIARQVQNYFWDIQNEFILVANENIFDAAYEELQKVIASFAFLPAMQKARQYAMDLASNALLGIMQTNAKSLENQQRIISETQDYTSNIQHEIFAGNAATHEHVAQMNSEMINEVNVFSGNGYDVQASTKFDHVYQNTQDPTIFAAQEGNGFDFGVDFEELDRKH